MFSVQAVDSTSQPQTVTLINNSERFPDNLFDRRHRRLFAGTRWQHSLRVNSAGFAELHVWRRVLSDKRGNDQGSRYRVARCYGWSAGSQSERNRTLTSFPRRRNTR